MKFKCDIGDVFVYPAKRTVNSYSMPWNITAEQISVNKVADQVLLSSIEFNECPICASKIFEEVVEVKPLETLAVDEWIEAPHSEANARLKEGYQVYKEYSKTVIMIKPKVEGVKA
jgi:hypothetical protein